MWKDVHESRGDGRASSRRYKARGQSIGAEMNDTGLKVMQRGRCRGGHREEGVQVTCCVVQRQLGYALEDE